jgi:hypothetical protein
VFVVAEASDGLMRPSPKGPGETVQDGEGPMADEIVEEPSHFRHTQGHHHGQFRPRWRLNCESELGLG